jgi:hypothetical protein
VAHEIAREASDQARAGEGETVDAEEPDAKQPAQSQVDHVEAEQEAATVELRGRCWQERRPETSEQVPPIRQGGEESRRKWPNHRFCHSIVQHLLGEPKSKPEKPELVDR